MFLFLDFDGTLHPENYPGADSGADLCHLPRLEALLREFPDVEIVVSSTWRERMSLEELRSLFAPDIRSRVVGTTALPVRVDGYARATCEAEIVAWLKANGRQDTEWVALNDADWQFDEHRHRLVLCSPLTGLDAESEAALRVHLARASATPEGSPGDSTPRD